jgi:hypothetical protein
MRERKRVGRYAEIDLSHVRGRPLAERGSLVSVSDFADPRTLETRSDPLEMFPNLLAGASLRRLADRIVEARRRDAGVVVMVGGHVIKTGVAPCLIRLLEAGFVTAVAGNGSVAIHDVEIALVGRTSEDVELGLRDGSFGIAEETATLLNRAAQEAADRSEGFGEAVGRILASGAPPHVEQSLLASAYRRGIPFTLHVAIGTDVVHQHASCDGASIGSATHRDFRILAAALAKLDGGVVLNVGSAVILPEVFVKALNVARHAEGRREPITTANLDFIQHYRPRQNVLGRPTRGGGEAIALTGHHEILVPLLVAAVLHRSSGP